MRTSQLNENIKITQGVEPEGPPVDTVTRNTLELSGYTTGVSWTPSSKKPTLIAEDVGFSDTPLKFIINLSEITTNDVISLTLMLEYRSAVVEIAGVGVAKEIRITSTQDVSVENTSVSKELQHIMVLAKDTCYIDGLVEVCVADEILILSCGKLPKITTSYTVTGSGTGSLWPAAVASPANTVSRNLYPILSSRGARVRGVSNDVFVESLYKDGLVAHTMKHILSKEYNIFVEDHSTLTDQAMRGYSEGVCAKALKALSNPDPTLVVGAAIHKDEDTAYLALFNRLDAGESLLNIVRTS